MFIPAVVVLGTTIACLALLGGGAWVFARLWARPRRARARSTPAQSRLDAQPVAFASGGKDLQGWFVPAGFAGSPAPVAILVHGWSSESSQMLPIAGRIHQAGFAVLAFDARGHGLSPDDGPITLKKYTEDIRAALAYADGRPDVDGGRMAIVGHSFGASSALLAAAQDPRAAAVVSLSAFSDPADLTRRTLKAMHLPRGPFLWLVLRVLMGWMDLSPDAVTPRAQIGRIKVPMLLAHGSQDRRVPPSELNRLVSMAEPSLVTRILVKGSGHRGLLTSAEMGLQIAGFLESALDVSATRQSDMAKVA